MLVSATTAFFNVNTVFFTVLGYPMSYLEFFGTLANIWSVWLIARNKILTWPVGIVGVVLFLALFFQIHLYSDMLEQFYFLVTGFWGWWVWSKASKQAQSDESTEILSSSLTVNLGWILATGVGTLLLAWFTRQLNVWLPDIFLAPPSYATLDALTTIMSFVATIMMVRKNITCWYYWIIVDIIGIGLYFAKDVRLLSLLYALFLVLAIQGWWKWRTLQKVEAHV